MPFVDAVTTAILPVLAVAGVGYLLGRLRDVDTDTLGTVTVYVLTPSLVFSTLATTTLSGGAVARIGLGVVAFVLAMGAVALVAVRVTGTPDRLAGAFVLASAVPNAGNYGIPLSTFAFGPAGRATAIVYIAAQSVLVYTLGVYVASGGARGSARRAVREVASIPLVYAVVAAGLARYLGVVPPASNSAMAVVSLVGNAAIPVMLLMLGIQVANATGHASLDRVTPPATLKLAVAPVVGAAVALLVGFGDPAVGRTFVLECAMPAAVTPMVLTVAFADRSGDGLDPATYISTTILLTTVASVATLAVVLAALHAGVLGV